MQVINIIENIGGVVSTIKSAVILDPNDEEAVIEKVEAVFLKIIKENSDNTFSEKEIDIFLEQGFSEDDYDVSIVWSEIIEV